MLGYRTGETPVMQVNVKKPKPFKWLRKLFRRIKFKHARFDDGKYARGQKDIEKWHEDTPLAKADYPDHRWQVVTRPRSRRSRNKNKDLQASSKPMQNRDTSEENKNTNNHSNNFLNMDTLKQVLDNDTGYPSGGHSGTGSRPTIRADVHSSPSWHNGCKDSLCRAVKSAEGSVRSHLSGYNTLDVELSPVPCDINTKRKATSKSGTTLHNSNAKSSLTSTDGYGHHKPSTISHTQAKSQKEGSSLSALNDSITHDHGNENDLNHMRAFEKRRFNKKPKLRKGKRRRPRRRGKYVELETTPSCESLEDASELVLGQRSSDTETVSKVM